MWLRTKEICDSGKEAGHHIVTYLKYKIKDALRLFIPLEALRKDGKKQCKVRDLNRIQGQNIFKPIRCDENRGLVNN